MSEGCGSHRCFCVPAKVDRAIGPTAHRIVTFTGLRAYAYNGALAFLRSAKLGELGELGELGRSPSVFGVYQNSVTSYLSNKIGDFLKEILNGF